ncbi:MAG TPA: putative Ig domain-containing protein [Herpetosiphonaceae bacterium]
MPIRSSRFGTLSFVLLLSLGFLFGGTTAQGQRPSTGGASFSGNSNSAPTGQQQPAPDLGGTVISQSTSQTILAQNSISCNQNGLHTDNSYFRAYDLSAFGINGDFAITAVQIGIERAQTPSGGQPVTIRLYNAAAFPAGFPGGAMLIGATTVTVANQSATVLPIPISATSVAGSLLIAEVFTPNGQATSNLFFIGSNNLGQSGPSYIQAAQCGAAAPTNTAAIGAANMHIVLNVIGDLAATANPDVATTAEDTPVTLNVLDNDSAPGTLSVSQVGAPANGTATRSGTTQIVYAPALNFAGTDTFTYTATNGTVNIVGQVTVTVTAVNDPPTVAAPIADQQATAGQSFTFVIPAGTFADPDTGDTLAYAASLGNGNPLPAWLNFNPTTRTFNGTPPLSTVGALHIRVTARDQGNASVSDTFTLTIAAKRIFLPALFKR